MTPPISPGPAVAATASTLSTDSFALFESTPPGSGSEDISTCAPGLRFPGTHIRRTAGGPAILGRRPPAQGPAGRRLTKAAALSSQEDSGPNIHVHQHFLVAGPFA
jgi:hypothetical protein